MIPKMMKLHMVYLVIYQNNYLFKNNMIKKPLRKRKVLQEMNKKNKRMNQIKKMKKILIKLLKNYQNLII